VGKIKKYSAFFIGVWGAAYIAVNFPLEIGLLAFAIFFCGFIYGYDVCDDNFVKVIDKALKDGNSWKKH
jgi:4-hydroxybenzoate polyprenyltransferase